MLSDVRIVLGNAPGDARAGGGPEGRPRGEQRTIDVVFPANHPNKKLAGQSAELHLSIKTVEEQSLPAVDEEFFRAYGVEQGGLAEMRAEVRKSMERELAEVIRSRLRVQVLDALYRHNPVDVPRALLDEQVQQLQIDTARRLGVREASQLPPREAFEEPARRRVALGLLVGQIVQAQGMKVDRERVQARVGRSGGKLSQSGGGATRVPAESGRDAADRIRGARGPGRRLGAGARADHRATDDLQRAHRLRSGTNRSTSTSTSTNMTPRPAQARTARGGST